MQQNNSHEHSCGFLLFLLRSFSNLLIFAKPADCDQGRQHENCSAGGQRSAAFDRQMVLIGRIGGGHDKSGSDSASRYSELANLPCFPANCPLWRQKWIARCNLILVSAHDQAPDDYRSVSMRRLIASTFASLDGIMQAPGGPEEDPTGGFTLGGWMFNFQDEAMDISTAGFDGSGREVVLGRRTYEIFEAYWPYQPDDNPIARTLNAAKKYIAS